MEVMGDVVRDEMVMDLFVVVVGEELGVSAGGGFGSRLSNF